MKTLMSVILLLIVGSGPALADVYSWVDANGIKHFSNSPPPADARSVQVTGEIQLPDSPATTGEPIIPFVNPASPSVTTGNRVKAHQNSPAGDRQTIEDLIVKEKQLLEEKIQSLNQSLADAERARSRGSSYEYQDWTVRIEQIENEIVAATREAESRIQQLNNQHGLE